MTTDKVFIQNQNPNALAYEYSAAYRFNSHFILEDNLVFLTETNHVSSGIDNWKRNILGSFRINDLFDIQFSNSINYVKYKVNGESYGFPEVNIVYDVLGGKANKVDNMVLSSGIQPGDMLMFSSIRIKLDMMLSESIGVDGQSTLATDFIQDNVLNYFLYCIPEDKILGFNSLSIECDF